MRHHEIDEGASQRSDVAGEGTTRRRTGQRGLRDTLANIETYSETVLGMPLRPYQAEVARAVLDGIDEGRGHTLTVLMPRQSGKNQPWIGPGRPWSGVVAHGLPSETGPILVVVRGHPCPAMVTSR